jgi:glycosyltransferase involved in cell wall biosynthesis
MPRPKVTVLLPVYNGERYLREAVDSILTQTAPDLQLLAIDDGSTDGTAEVLSSYRDPRVRVHTHRANRGLIATLNEGLELAEGIYLARMDADDVAHPERLARQTRYLDAHPEVAIVGSDARSFGGGTSSWAVPCDAASVRARLLFGCALAHSSVVLRPDLLRREGLRYDPGYPLAEDYALWVAVAERAPVVNLPDKLMRIRLHEQSVSRVHRPEQLRSVRRIRAGQLERLGLRFTDAELDLHEEIATGVFTPSAELLDRADVWLRRVAGLGPRLGPGGDAALVRESAFRWARLCRRSRRLGLVALRRFLASPLHRQAPAVSKAEVALGALAGALRPGAGPA